MNQSNIAVKPVAGPELDAAIAEHVFGWKRFEGQEACFAALPHMAQVKPWMRHVKRIWIDPARPDVYQACLECGNMPAFSTEIAEAWKVVEKIGQCETPVIEQVRILSESGNYWGWAVRFGKLKRGEEHIIALTAPLAICLAALRAVGVEVSE